MEQNNFSRAITQFFGQQPGVKMKKKLNNLVVFTKCRNKTDSDQREKVPIKPVLTSNYLEGCVKQSKVILNETLIIHNVSSFSSLTAYYLVRLDEHLSGAVKIFFVQRCP